MSTINRLNALKYIDVKIKSKRQEIANLKSSIVRSQNYSDEPKGSRAGNSVEDLNIKIIDEAERLRSEIDRLLTERQEVIQAIESLEDPLENIVLRLMYVNNYSWQEVRHELNCSHGTVQRARSNGIENLNNKL